MGVTLTSGWNASKHSRWDARDSSNHDNELLELWLATYKCLVPRRGNDDSLEHNQRVYT